MKCVCKNWGYALIKNIRGINKRYAWICVYKMLTWRDNALLHVKLGQTKLQQEMPKNGFV